MDFLPSRLDNEWWLNFFQWISTGAIAITLFAAYCVNIFAERVNKAMKIEIARSNTLAARSNEVAATANTRTEELRAENLKLGVQLEKERQARLEIERRLAPRYISPKEEKIILDTLLPHAGHKVTVAVIGDPESNLYAQQFAKVFERAKWRVERLEGALLGPPQYGLFLVVPKQPDEAVKALTLALQKAGLKVPSQIDERFTTDTVILRVGNKDPTEATGNSIP